MVLDAVPVFLLDTDWPENSEWDRRLTDSLYGGDAHYRLCQEIVLGIGGVPMLRALGHSALTTFHMNEGHASLLTLALLGENSVTPILQPLPRRIFATFRRNVCSQPTPLFPQDTTNFHGIWSREHWDPIVWALSTPRSAVRSPC
jgi:hypothetical protein